ncbi:hypothetical protein EDI_342000 [Entamoeba dispar SAW760]|uniref:AVL9/DENND6 domain-containing protein n=1 Tax=Entamoeba dispar (strain ATCC PRA-260 / SAW760) TaxID=370354 RepID=B0E9N2_ENTDS|nr:uncharacterized protein EDI_342000 [Entamoeba dispar SAW760]EDR28750.1 hypothetical protein EDI_342000 [Entamoeba dispar SAW760]|eukprot:EDR28750.1 hypothetical protein EDI_342000 [Entamoeba dispar SAW760]
MTVNHIILCSDKRGIIITYPLFPEGEYNYNSIPHICFSDCPGNYNYFTVPCFSINPPLYGIAWFNKYNFSQYLPGPENPKEDEQIALCMITSSPYLHLFLQRFKPLADLYFIQNSFINNSLIQAIFKTLNCSMNDPIYTLPDPCSLINACGKNILLLVKMLLLKCRICVNNKVSSDINSEWILALLSFIPGALFPATDTLKSIGFVTQTKQSIIHCPLSEIELIENVEIFGGTHPIFREMAEIDCVITEKGVIVNGKYKKILEQTKADKVFTQQLLSASRSMNYDLAIDLILQYIVGLISVAVKSRGRWIESQDVMNYGSSFVEEFKKTEFFKSLPSNIQTNAIHPAKLLNSVIDFSSYKKSTTVKVNTISGTAFPLYKKYLNSNQS